MSPAHDPIPAAHDPRPVLFVTGHAPPDRVGAFVRLHELEDVHFALFGGRTAHGPAHGTAHGPAHGPAHGTAHDTAHPPPHPAAPDPTGDSPIHAVTSEHDRPFPSCPIRQQAVYGLASSGRYRVVICGTGGRIALPGAWLGARRAGVPFLLWSSLWAHPLTVAHAASYPLLLSIYSSASAIVTYGAHVSAYVRARGARNVHIAPQAVNNDFWSAPADTGPSPDASFTALFAGRPVPEKGLHVLERAWAATGLGRKGGVLVVAGSGPRAPVQGRGRAVDPVRYAGITAVGPQTPLQLRNLYAAADVLIMPSVRTRRFREPWGLVANEALNQGIPVIATDEVGAAAGGLIRHERNGLIVRAGNVADLAAAILRVSSDPDLRARLGAAGARDVAAFTHEAWAAGFAAALRSVSASREPC